MRQKLRIPIVLEIFKQTNNGAFQKFLGLDNFQTLQVIDKIEMQTPKLKDLKTDHIQNIIKWFENQNALHRLNKEYLEYFNKRINDGK